MICIYSIFLNHKPDTLMIHCFLHGYYWEKIKKIKALYKLIRFNHIPTRSSIFGNQGPYALSHR